MEKTILEIQNLTKYYGKIKGVENLSLKLEEGEIFGFIGPNGAGKSTTIRSIMNLINKTSGKVLVENKEFNKDDIEIKEKIGYLPSEIYLYDDLTVKEMLDYHESFYKKDIHKRRIELVKRLELDEKKKIDGAIKKLVEEGLPSTLQKAMDTVRIVGDEAVHPGEINVDDNKELAIAMFRLMNIIIEKMIVEPKEIDNLYNLMPDNKLQGIENRDKNNA